MNNDKEILKEQYNNFIYPKPVENIDEEVIKIRKIPYSDPNFSWHILWPEKNHQSSNLKILIAGCGSDQAAIIAKCNPNHSVIGIDISPKSIAHQNKLKKNHKINNLKLICDDFRDIKFDYKFDYIISTGVIHHLQDPLSALKYFYENLNDDGVINLMIYGNLNSFSINKVKEIYSEMNLNHSADSINIAKSTIQNLNKYHPGKIFAQKINDFNYDSGVIDFLLHKQELFFDIDKLINIFQNSNFKIKNFYDGNICSLTKFFLNNDEAIKKIRNFDKNMQLKYGQILNWNDRKIELVLCKNSNNQKSLFYDDVDIMNCYIYPSKNIKYKINSDNINVEELQSEIKYIYKFSKEIDLNWKEIFSGKTLLKNSFKNNDSNVQEFIKNFFELLFENRQIDISLKPIANYLEYLGK